MRNYIFTYFYKNDGEESLQTQEYVIRCNRLSQAFSSFRDFFNSLVGFRDYALDYRVVSSSGTSYRILSSKYFSSLDRRVPDYD